MKIRTDLEGVVTAYGEDEALHVLKAGDEVPDGVTVGDHVTEPASGDEAADGAKPARRRTSK